MLDALRSYLQLASGLAEVSANKARETASSLVAQTPDASQMAPDAITSNIQAMAEDLVEQSRTNSEIVVGLVKTEVDRTVGRMGFVREEELAALRRHVQRLEDQLGARSGQAVDAATTAVTAANSAVSAAQVGARSAAATAKTAATTAANAAKTAPRVASRTSTTKSSTAKAAPAPAAKKAPAKKAPAKKSAAKKAPAKKAPAKKSAAKKAPAKKSTAKKSTSK